MKLMQLLERTSDIAYHYTTLMNAYKVLSKNKFILTPVVKNSSEKINNHNKYYFMSMSRSIDGAYHRDAFSGVLFVLDGSRLNHNFKTKAYNYWSKDYMDVDEMEDRLFSDSESIPSTPYIKEVKVLLDTSKYKQNNQYVFEIYSFCRKNNIPVSVYSEKSDWLHSRNPLDHENILKVKTRYTQHPESRSRRKSDLRIFLELAYVNNLHRLSPEALKFINSYTQYGRTGKDDLHSNISNELSNASLKRDGVSRKDAVGMVKLMRKRGTHELRDVTDAVFDSYKKQDEDKAKKEIRQRLLKVYNSNKELYDRVNDAMNHEVHVSSWDVDKYDIERIINNLIKLGLYKNKSDIDDFGSVDMFTIEMRLGLY